MNVFPNPCTNEITLDIPKQVAADWKVSVYNVLGEVMPIPTVLPGNKLDITSLAKGWYRLLLTSGENNYSTSFVKE